MNADVFIPLAIALVNYLIGSIPFSYLIAKAKGIDLKYVGSGNVGATNVARSLGYGFGLVALLLDLIKGVVGALLVLGASLPIFISAFSVFGHNWSLFLGFKSGKGVATSLGIVLVLHWPTFLIAILMWGLVAFVTRYVSVASVAALMSVPVLLLLFEQSLIAVVTMAGLGVLSALQHRENLNKLISGTESRLK